MERPLILLDKKLIKQYLQDENRECDIRIFESLDSTNDYLKSFFNYSMSIICLAEQQTKGRGRLDRNWYSPFGKNLYFSCLYAFNKNINELAGLSLVVGLAIVRTLKAYNLPESLLIKWPNDIHYQDKKLSGILIETNIKDSNTCHVIIGIGINVNMIEDENKKILQPWTSLKTIMNNDIDRNSLCAFLINNLFVYLKKFASLGLNAFIDEWKKSDYLLDKKISLNSTNQLISGKARGINEQGYLLLELDNGKIQAFSAGDTSISK